MLSHYNEPIFKKLIRFGIKKNEKQIKKKIKKEKSQYYIRLEEKQKLRFYYGISEEKLRKYIYISKKYKGPTSKILLKLLSMRLDYIILKLNICKTIFEAHQYINHKNILVNNKLINIPNFCCNPNDKITVLKPEKKIYSVYKTKFNKKKWISLKSNNLKIIEYYSNLKI
uniref:ribosomal protein S4 n=1 Tax=Hydnora esculenta TaxID=1851369 RepID=UPI0021139963|nr:ribosomal protein S4 [Hydnora esculenta]USN93637.1 ribosomal protein S4 [Hydnora esculenta]